MISSARKVISLTISEKLGTTQRYKVCDIESLSTLVTELENVDPKLEQFKNRGIEIL